MITIDLSCKPMYDLWLKLADFSNVHPSAAHQLFMNIGGCRISTFRPVRIIVGRKLHRADSAVVVMNHESLHLVLGKHFGYDVGTAFDNISPRGDLMKNARIRG